jgi:adenosylcobyric acid synthase
MVQGTASHVGKSVLVAALCRIFRQDGFRVAPFKAQNMSNNSYVTPDGGEIGRAQAVQAEAAGIDPTVEMNPILLKPEAHSRSQMVVLGKPLRSAESSYFSTIKPQLWETVSRSLDSLREQYDVVVIEGAGSPAEINLKQTEIVNMRVALYANAPVLLAGDIDRGGVFASLVGTLELLEPEERDTIKGFIINKFRGDVTLLEPGLRFLEERTGIPVSGVVPYYIDIHIPEEDAVSLEERRDMKAKTDFLLDVAVIGFPHISNFDDFDPLKREPGVRLRYVESNDTLGSPDLVILPGTKTTIADLAWLRERGFAGEIRQLSRNGAAVIGICGGYQMLGERVLDPEGVESSQSEMEGLGLLPVTTIFAGTKETHRVRGEVGEAPGILEGAAGLSVEGYEIHMGRSFYSDYSDGSHHPGPSSGETAQRPARHSRESGNPPINITQRSGNPVDGPDGAIDPGGRIFGTYIHGLFHNPGLRRAILHRLARWKGVTLPEDMESNSRDEEYDKLAALVRRSLDMESIYRMTGLEVSGQ